MVRLARARPGLSGAVALFVLLVLVYCTSIDIRASRGASITGDEPFYLITTQSLLQDGGLDLRNQYATRSYESFFGHADGLWTQSVPLADGRVLSPHNVGLSLLVLPGFAIDGLVGVQVQLVLIAVLTWALAYVLALLVVTGRERLSPTQVLALVVLLSALPWLGAKYAPLSALVALYVLWRAEPRGRAVLLAGGTLSALGYAAFHLATYESLTPYNVNLVYAGGSTATIVGEHVEIGDRSSGYGVC